LTDLGLKNHTDDKESLLSLLNDYSSYIALLAGKIEGATPGNNKSQIAEARHSLQQFPPIAQEEYLCLGGSSARLSNRLSALQHQSLTLAAHENVINKAVAQFSKKDGSLVEVHIKPMLNYFLGVDQKIISEIDYNYRSPIGSIAAQEMWQFVSSYQKNLNEERIREAINLLQKRAILPAMLQNYQDLPNIFTEEFGVEFENGDFVNERGNWKNLSEIEQAIKDKISQKTANPQGVKSSPAASRQVEGGLTDILDDNDYFSKYLPSSIDIAKPEAIKIIVELAKDQDLGKRHVALSALRILGENKRDQEPNKLIFLAILQEIGLDNKDGVQREIGYKKALGITRSRFVISP